MNYEQVTEYARFQLTVDQVEILLGLDEDAIANDPKASRAYRVGKAQGVAQIRGTLMKEVAAGNVSAARLMNDYAQESEPEYVEG